MFQHKLYPGRRPVVFLPLFRGNNKAGPNGVAAAAGRGQGGVVGKAQIVAEPDQLCHWNIHFGQRVNKGNYTLKSLACIFAAGAILDYS